MRPRPSRPGKEHGPAKAVEALRNAKLVSAFPGPPKTLDARPATECAGEPLPRPLLRRADDPSGSVLAAGDVAVLSGAGGAGKSSLVVALGVGAAPELGEAAALHVGEENPSLTMGRAAGLNVATGPVLLLTWEDRRAVLGRRAMQYADALHPDVAEAAAANLLVADMREHGPLYGPPPPDDGRAALTNTLPEATPAWRMVWEAVDSTGARLLIVDPVTAALAGDMNSWHVVRMFVSALGAEAATHEHGVGVLLVHHSTKAARKKDGEDVDRVGGAATWIDAARGVLVLVGEEGRRAKLECAKANHGPLWSAHLRSETDTGALAWTEAEDDAGPVDSHALGRIDRARKACAEANRRAVRLAAQADKERAEATTARQRAEEHAKRAAQARAEETDERADTWEARAETARKRADEHEAAAAALDLRSEEAKRKSTEHAERADKLEDKGRPGGGLD